MSGRSVFRLLLRLYPPWFRDRYGAEMVAEFDAARARYTTQIGAGKFWLGIIWDSIKTVPRAWWHTWTAPHQQDPHNGRERQMLANLLKDIQLAFRGVSRRPGPALVAIVALGLGIGLTAGMFSIVNGVILKGLPVEQPHELVAINRISPAQGPSRLLTRIHDFVDLQERQTTFEGVAAYEFSAFNLSSGDEPAELVTGANITANTFDVLKTPPIMGRGFAPEDEVIGAPSVVLIGYQFWQDRFNGAPNVVGRMVRLDGQPTEVIGIMPEGFTFPFNQKLWRPLPAHDLSTERGSGPSLLAFGRLSDGTSMEQGQADLTRIMTQLAAEYPDTNAGMTVKIGPYVNEAIGYQTPGLLYTMLAAVSLVLLIACANVANLLLARATLRGKEVAVKTALGASRGRVVTQLLADSAVIAVLGALLGLGIAQLAIEMFNRALLSFPGGVPFWFSIGLDGTVLLFVVLLTVGASLLSGVIPALRASRANVNEILKDDSRGASSLKVGRLSRGLVVVEVAFSFALLVATGFMVKSVTNLANVDYPFATENIFVAALSLPPADYPTNTDRLQLYDRLRESLSGEPAVVSGSINTELPAAGFGNGRFELETETYLGDRDYPSARIGSIDPAYFETVSAQMMDGRAFAPSDNDTSIPVAIVNEKFTQTYFEGESALGRRLKLRRVSQPGAENQGREDWYTIVGVAPDFYLEGDVFVLNPEAIYLPMAQRPASVANLMIHTRGDPLQFTSRAREIVAELDPNLAISQVNTLEATIENGAVFFTIFGAMFSIFGVAALFLASVGLYGVLSFSVNQRQRELGLRVALGASPRKVVRLVLRQAGYQLALGMLIGAGLSVVLVRGISFVLFDVNAAEWGVFFGVAALLAVTTLVACFVPARRATQIDPMVAMQAE